MSELNKEPKATRLEQEPMLIGNDTAAYLELLVESQRRKEELERIKGLLREAADKTAKALTRFQLKLSQVNDDLCKANSAKELAVKQVAVIARGVCPVLRLFLLAVGGIDGDAIVKANPTCERDAREMLTLLERFEKS